MAPQSGDEEDDYLTMTFADPTTTSSGARNNKRKAETLTERTKRLARERELKANPKSKAELAADAKRRREEALQRSLFTTGAEGKSGGDGHAGSKTSKGAAMMAKLGYIPGTALGKESTSSSAANGEVKDERLLEPIGISEREGRGGIGADAERKRKIREEVEARVQGEKRAKVDAEGYRERQAREREEARWEGQLRGAMGVAEGLDERDGGGKEEGEENGGGEETANGEQQVQKKRRKGRRRLQDVNVLWRGLVRQREINERDRRMRYDLHQSQSSRADYNDLEEDREDRIALGKKETEEVDSELDDEDEELNDFEALPVQERLERLVKFLREEWRYCFWCKMRYEDEAMEGCPGVKEEDHD